MGFENSYMSLQNKNSQKIRNYSTENDLTYKFINTYVNLHKYLKWQSCDRNTELKFCKFYQFRWLDGDIKYGYHVLLSLKPHYVTFILKLQFIFF